MDHRLSMENYFLELCHAHTRRLDRLVRKNNTPVEAIQLYYGLKAAGMKPMLEWWDGTKFVHVALSRIRLNIQIDTDYQMFTYEQVINCLGKSMHFVKDGYTTISVPSPLITNYLKETVDNITTISEGLKGMVKAV